MVRAKIRRLMIFGLSALCVITYLSVKHYYKMFPLRVKRMVGAVESNRDQWPWQVSIHYGPNNDGESRNTFICGGALIGTKWVLTAAHCLYRSGKKKDSPNEYTIIAGNDSIAIGDPKEQVRKNYNIHIHEKYNNNFIRLGYDIALIELDQEITLDPPYVDTISLPETEEKLSTPTTTGWVAGWGRQGEKLPTSNKLRHASFTIQRNELCVYREPSFNENIKFCAGDGKGNKAFCNGDSGGPFVRRVTGPRKWVAIGLVSWSVGCARKGNYDYYTRLEPFVDWIKDIREKSRTTLSPTTISRSSHNHMFFCHIFLLLALISPFLQ